MSKYALYTILLILSLSTIVSAEAVSLSVSPKELKISANVYETATQKLKIKNPSGEVSIFEVYPDDLDEIVRVSPSSFILESEEEKEVTVQVIPRKEGIFRTDISVVASPVASSSFNAGGGVKIPLEIRVGQKSSWFLALMPQLPLTYSRILGVLFLFIVVGVSYLVIKYGIKQIKG